MAVAYSPHPELTEALRLMEVAQDAYTEAGNMYDGVVDEVLASEKLRDVLGDDAQRFRINYARTPVDVLLERTKIQGWTVSNTQQLAAIEQVWADNELGIEAKDVHLKAFEYGDGYLIAWPEEDDPDFPGKLSVYVHGPQHVRVFYDPEKPRRKRLAVHRFQVQGIPGEDGNGLGEGLWQRVNLYYPDRVEQWVSDRPLLTAAGQPFAIKHDSTFEHYGEGDEWVIPNPVDGVIPVFHFRTARPYGRPEHADAYGPQYAINKLLVSLMGAVDFAAIPQRYVATDSALDGQTAPVDAFAEVVGDTGLIDTEYTDDGLSRDSQLGSAPGDTWLLSGRNVRPGQFSAADTKNFVEPMESLIAQMADVTDLPSNRYTRGGQQPSGDSQRMSERPLNNKTNDRHAQFGVTWHEFAEYICLVNNLGETDAQVAWDPPTIDNDEASWKTAQLQLTSGVPWDQAMRERGYSSEWIAENEAYAVGVVAALVGSADTLNQSRPEET